MQSKDAGVVTSSFLARKLPRVFVSWLLEVSKQLRKRRFHYVTLSFPFFRRQFFLKKSERLINEVELRDSVDLITFQEIFGSGEYVLERLTRYSEILDLYRCIRQGGSRPLIFDCGANIGLASVHFGLEWPGSKIVAIEPDEANVGQAQKNCARFDVELIHAAVGSEPGRVEIFDPGMGNNALRVRFSGDGVIPVITIPDLLKNFPPPEFIPFLIKIDIEGSEEELFSRNIDWIGNFPLLIIELHDWMHTGTGNSRNFLKAIADSGRDFVYLNDTVFSIRNPLSG